ncbi:GNAT family N-acetyltransferase [Azospirillum rugosum]|uniref:Ribosomal protein S18 acetylase RimI-like enzyme n=1 Tax=Azospirillum rugosum TaxID=416170 RepID=A0ABS4SCR0_9PROT|nr:GNAT family N-acetyltransferase [Azospirillum rugosum]MBP2290339.1 ribosomal protein S18 acetylase RimI-like enzyme [Azospirillum rugosum]MDQ0527815.1 ribosomal protein S18 acetylase RimI-like enzyme [Azospirillum rugosum]
MGEGMVIRDARPSDAVGIAKVHVASWRETYPGLVPDTYLVNLSEAAAAMRWHNAVQAHAKGQGALVVVDGMDKIVGFATYGGRRVPVEGYEGEFYALYLLEEAKSQGIGRRLMAVMAERLLESGQRNAVVWCLRDNPSRWFYERLGGTRVAERPIQFAGADLVEIAYGWQDLTPLARLSAGPEMR